MSGKIRGEYWIVDGRIDFADGDVGDQNHEMIALNSIASDHIEEIQEYARELGIDTEELGIHDEPFTTASEFLASIGRELLGRGLDSKSAAEQIMKRLGIDAEVYKMMGGGGDARLFVMKKDGWVAVRSNNIELFGYDQSKRKEIINGIEEILDQEGIEEPDEEIEFSLYDHRTGRSSQLNLADIKGESQMRPQTLPDTKYNRPLFIPREKTGSMPKPMDARTRNMLQTSENRMDFRSWLSEGCPSFIVRRAWPLLTGGGQEEPNRRSSHRSRRGRRR